MKIVMTLMVRDEADIVAGMLEHHLAQGIDTILVTDNGSIDGTREILAEYEGDGRVVVTDDPVQQKQQAKVVTGMARRAAAEFGADWVINADADEFFVAVDRSRGVRDALERIPKRIGSFTAPVVNLTGMPGKSGSGVSRLVFRDEREASTLWAAAGLHAHPTGDAIHVGDPAVEVVQGNHFVNIEQTEPVPLGAGIEVLHLPWRSWAQYARKVENTGRAYEANPNVHPSPRHHGMRDWRLMQAGCLEDCYVYRHPDVDAGEAIEPAFPRDTTVLDSLRALEASGLAVRPDRLAAVLDDPVSGYTSADFAHARAIAPIALALEEMRGDDMTALRDGAQRHEAARIAELQRSATWRVGRAALGPVRAIRSLLRR